MYDLAIEGYAGFTRQAAIFSQRKIARDPLTGLLDGSNAVFFANYYPMLTSGSLLVYSSGSLVSGTADYDTGEITLDAAPASQPTATYFTTPYTTQQIIRVLIEGFYDMESRWTRGYSLVDAAGLPATETSANLYIVDRSTGSDPVCGPILFSQSAAQVGLFLACVRYQFLALQLGDSSISDYLYQDSRAMKIDKSDRPRNIELALKAAEKRIADALEQAQIEFYQNGELWGAYIPSPESIDYEVNFKWQVDGVVPPTGYHVSVRTFG